MNTVDDDTAVGFRFGDCDGSIVARTIITAADHLCGSADISIALLDALEVPLAESLVALNDSSVESVVVEVENDRLTLDIGVRRELPDDLTEVFGDASQIIDSFFVVDRRSDARSVVLVGSLS